MLAAPPSPPLPPLLPRPRNPFGAASFPQASIPGEKRKLCFLLRSGENRASLSPGPGGDIPAAMGVWWVVRVPPLTPPPPPPEVAVARSRSCLLRCLWDRGGLLATASGSLVIYGRGGLIKERASVCTEQDGRSPCAASLGEKGRRGTGSRGTELSSEGVICWGARLLSVLSSLAFLLRRKGAGSCPLGDWGPGEHSAVCSAPWWPKGSSCGAGRGRLGMSSFHPSCKQPPYHRPQTLPVDPKP